MTLPKSSIIRISRVIRAPALTVIPIGDLVVDTERMLALSNGVKIKLKGKEYHILEYLSRHLGEPASAETLVEHLYGGFDTPEAKIVDFFIGKLRRKIDLAGGKTTIVMIPGRGYLLHTLSEAGILAACPPSRA